MIIHLQLNYENKEERIILIISNINTFFLKAETNKLIMHSAQYFLKG